MRHDILQNDTLNDGSQHNKKINTTTATLEANCHYAVYLSAECRYTVRRGAFHLLVMAPTWPTQTFYFSKKFEILVFMDSESYDRTFFRRKSCFNFLKVVREINKIIFLVFF